VISEVKIKSNPARKKPRFKKILKSEKISPIPKILENKKIVSAGF
jgi:hypothetical protein